jgi:hypothetical protein
MDPMTAGERIVAFARPGKPPKIPFQGRIERFLSCPKRSDLLRNQQFLKHDGVGMALPRSN